MRPLRLVFIGLTITSSWGNGHATTYRALLRALARRGHRLLFLEHDKPWYAENRDLPQPAYCATRLYASVDALKTGYRDAVAKADAVIIGSFVPEGVEVVRWVQATARGIVGFYDIDTPVTLAALEREDCAYLSSALIPGFDVYWSFTGGPTLARLESGYGARRARPLYCSVDPEHYHPEPQALRWHMGYLGTYSEDRQPTVEALLNGPARRLPQHRFVVAGPMYPERLTWRANVERIAHLAPDAHRAFYNAQRFTLNVTRAAMIAAGWSPSVRLFEAAACGTPIVSDWWEGLDALLRPGEEILIARSAEAAAAHLAMPETERRRVGEAARARVLAEHTAAHRAQAFEDDVDEAMATALVRS